MEGEAGAAMRKVEAHFTQLGIPFEVDHVDGEPMFQSLGLAFSFGGKVCVRATPQRAWRLWAATKCLLRRRRISGESMRLWLGHVNCHFLLSRRLLSTLFASYSFARAHLGHRFPMWASVRREIRIVLGLLFLEKDLSQPVNTEVHVGDSSDLGFGLMVRHESIQRIQREMLYDERWRFLDRQDVEGARPFNGGPGADGAGADGSVFLGPLASPSSRRFPKLKISNLGRAGFLGDLRQ